MKKITLLFALAAIFTSCGSSEAEAPVEEVQEEMASTEMLSNLSAAQALDNDIAQLNYEIDSLLNSL